MLQENFIKKYLFIKDNDLTKNNSDRQEDENKENKDIRNEEII